MNFTELLRSLNGILRYFATAIVGVSLVWAFDDGHDAISDVVAQVWAPSNPGWPPTWAIVGALAAVGLLTYYIHRTAFHPFFLRLNRRMFGGGWLSDDDLRRMRWVRKGAEVGTSKRSVQDAVDEMCSSAHFLYCSAWAALIIAAFTSRLTPNLRLTSAFWGTVLGLLALGFRADVHASAADVSASRWYPEPPAS
jgi:hypothetical protein